MVRTRRLFTPYEADALLADLKDCRRACVRALAKAPINGPVARAVSGVTAAIDQVAEVITGDREHFWSKTASTGPEMRAHFKPED
ncbi:hypothetical protein SLNSH_06705 [Alsobacter soli]|uniref:Uncharacterized protein n=1 Tax=Alsobacter soli TaxID=2109933 RepID=A0A2T1HVL3_9HYPH|nr:hypothetical protein [Alsobacter soli]PSC05668.1 hypothetical protein SLNSH_06705 [Alsobacter soli]